MEDQRIATRLDELFFKVSLSFSQSNIICNAILLLVNIVKVYAIPEFEKTRTAFITIAFSRIGSIIAFFALFLVTLKCKKKLFSIVIYTLLPVFAFEVNCLTISYTDAFIVFLMFYNSFREILLLGANYKFIYLNQAITVLYLIGRAIHLKMTKQFPFFMFLIYMVTFIFVNIPIMSNYSKIRNIIIESDQIQKDFANILLSLPIPVIKFAFKPMRVVMHNIECLHLLEKNNFKQPQDFIRFIYNDSKFYNRLSTYSQMDSYVIKINEKEYNIRYSKLENSNNEDFFILAIEDLSLAKEIECLKAKQMYKQMFLSVVNHQLRTPLNGIYNPLIMIKENYSRPDFTELLDVAINSVETLSALIDDTISFSQCEEGSIHVFNQKADLIYELNNIKKMFAFEAKQKSLNFSINIDLKHSTVTTDIKKVNQILIILVSNAFKYTFSGSISLKCTEQGSFAIFEVSDTGIGVKESKLLKIFNEFNSVEAVNTEKLTSSGFQLSLVNKLVQLMEGSLSVESQLGVGTKFIIKLKVEWEIKIRRYDSYDIPQEALQIAKLPLGKFSKLVDISRTDLSIKFHSNNLPSKKYVLIVDDNSSNLFVLQKMLESIGVQSEKAMNGLECVNKYKSNMKLYSLVLMDINMPIMNGFEATKEIKKISIENNIECPPIVAVTAQNEACIIQQCQSYGMLECIFKPVKLKELHALAKRIMLIY